MRSALSACSCMVLVACSPRSAGRLSSGMASFDTVSCCVGWSRESVTTMSSGTWMVSCDIFLALSTCLSSIEALPIERPFAL